MAGMLHCPRCTGELVSYRETVLIGGVKGWKCVFCEKSYRMEELVRAILTV
jgi:transposase-like protein